MKTSNENYKYTFFKYKNNYYLAISFKKLIPENCSFLILHKKNASKQMEYYEYKIDKNRNALVSLGANWENITMDSM